VLRGVPKKAAAAAAVVAVAAIVSYIFNLSKCKVTIEPLGIY